MITRQVKRIVSIRFGHYDLTKRYCEGSRSLGDFLESIVSYDLAGDPDEADYWRSEVRVHFPEFVDSI